MKTNLANCKRLYELSSWDSGKYRQPLKYGGRSSNYPPAYDSDYLLGKLPYRVLDEYQGKVYGVNLKATASGGWVVWYGEIGKTSEMYFNSADTPADALALLAIKLFESGVLKK